MNMRAIKLTALVLFLSYELVLLSASLEKKPDVYAKDITRIMIHKFTTLQEHQENSLDLALDEVEHIREQLRQDLLSLKPAEDSNEKFIEAVQERLSDKNFRASFREDVAILDSSVSMNLIGKMSENYLWQFKNENYAVACIEKIKGTKYLDTVQQEDLEKTVGDILEGYEFDSLNPYFTVEELIETQKCQRAFHTVLHKTLLREKIRNQNLLFFNRLIDLATAFLDIKNYYALAIVEDVLKETHKNIVDTYQKEKLYIKDINLRARTLIALPMISSNAQRLLSRQDVNYEHKYFPSVRSEIISMHSPEYFKAYERQERLDKGKILVDYEYLLDFMEHTKNTTYLDEETLIKISSAFKPKAEASAPRTQVEIFFEGGRIVEMHLAAAAPLFDFFEFIIKNEKAVAHERKKLKVFCDKNMCSESYEFLRYYFDKKETILEDYQRHFVDIVQLASGYNSLKEIPFDNIFARVGAETLRELFQQFMPFGDSNQVFVTNSDNYAINLPCRYKYNLLTALTLKNNAQQVSEALEEAVLHIVTLIINNSIIMLYFDDLLVSSIKKDSVSKNNSENVAPKKRHKNSIFSKKIGQKQKK